MPLARIILKATTGVPLHERFTRFMKQRGAEEASAPGTTQQTIHRKLPMQDLSSARESRPAGATDRNRRLAEELGRRADRHRSRSPQRRNGDRSRDRNESSAKSRLGGIHSRVGGGNSRDEPRSRSGGDVRDRVGGVKDRVGKTLSDRLGKKPIKDRVELPSAQERVGRPNPVFERRGSDGPRGGFRGGGRGAGSSRGGRGGNRGGGGAGRENRGPLDQDKLDKEMDDYMAKSKGGLDKMLDDYMTAGGDNKKSEKPEINENKENAENTT